MSLPFPVTADPDPASEFAFPPGGSVLVSDGQGGIILSPAGTYMPTMPVSTLLGRKASGDIAPLTPDEANTILGGGGSTLARAIWAVTAATYDAGTDSFLDSTGRGSNAVLGSAVGADANDPPRYAYDGANRYIRTPGTVGNYVSLPGVNIPGDHGWAIGLAMDNWAPGAASTVASKFTTAANQRGWRIDISALGVPSLTLSVDGIAIVTATASAALTTVMTNGAIPEELYVTWRQSDGRVQFWWAPTVGGAYTQLGIDKTAAVASVFASTANLNLSGFSSGASQPTKMSLYRYREWSDITQTTLVVDLNPNDPSLTAPWLTFIETAGQTTATINRSLTGLRAAVITRPAAGFTSPAYLETANNPNLDFAAGESFTFVTAFRLNSNPAATQVLAAKKADLAGDVGWAVTVAPDGRLHGILNDGTHSVDLQSSGPLNLGYDNIIAFIRDAGLGQVRLNINGTDDTTAPDTTAAATLANANALRIGRLSGAGTNYADHLWFASNLYRSALTAAALVTLQAELALNVTTKLVPTVGSYAALSTPVVSGQLVTDGQPRFQFNAAGDLYYGDGTNALRKFMSASRATGGTPSQLAGNMSIGLDAGKTVINYRCVTIGRDTLRDSNNGQSCTVVGDQAAVKGLSNEIAAFGVNCLNAGGGNFPNVFGSHGFESAIAGAHRLCGLGDECSSYSTTAPDIGAYGFYAGSIWNGGTNGAVGHSPNGARCLWIGNYTGYKGDAALGEATDAIAEGYRAVIGQGANFAMAFGSGADAEFPGSVAFGVDHTGLAAVSGAQDEYKMGTPLTCLRSGGTVASGLGTLAGTGKWRLGQIRVAAVALDAARYLETEIDGALVKVLVAA